LKSGTRIAIKFIATDLILPGGISGKDLGERLLQERPTLKVIYASGHSAEFAANGFSLEEGANFLSKPFQPFTLEQTVRRTLDAIG
jgi:FixJ family two-component response regulator